MFTFLINHTPLFYFTQSVWRDEVFSILVAEQPPVSFIGKLSFEPPVYYLLLHAWMKIFGGGEIAARSLSLVGLALATYVVILWSEQLFKKHWLSWFLPVFFFLNPMLLYYGFEVRTYSWYVFFAVLSMYAYWNKNWKLYVPATVLGFYTHVYMIIIPFIQAVHYVLTTPHARRLKGITKNPMIRSLIAIGVLIAPWGFIIAREATRLKQSWYFPVDLRLVQSVLGNMFLGYEGTPWYGWRYTRILSLIILGASILALKNKKTRKPYSFFFLMMLVPLAIVIGISFAKPLFVNRYLIPVTVAQVFLLTFALSQIKRKTVQKVLAGAFLAFVLLFNFWYPSQHAKINYRKAMLQINALRSKNDVVFAETPLIFFEVYYYSNDRANTFLYNPNGNAFPWFVGDAVFPQAAMVRDFPEYPRRAFLIHTNGGFDIVYNAPFTTSVSMKP